MELTSEWQSFDGDYEKEIQDIQLKDGTIISECWPNAGFFIPSGGKKHIPVDQVKFVRLSDVNY